MLTTEQRKRFCQRLRPYIIDCGRQTCLAISLLFYLVFAQMKWKRASILQRCIAISTCTRVCVSNVWRVRGQSGERWRRRAGVREVIGPFQGHCSASARLVLIVVDYFRHADCQLLGDRKVIIDIRQVTMWILQLYIINNKRELFLFSSKYTQTDTFDKSKFQ